MRASGALMCLYRHNTRLLATMLSPVAKNATRRWIRWRSAGLIFERKSPTSVEKSTSSTVQVLRMALLYISKNRGYASGRRLRHRPGSSSFAGLGVLERTAHRLGSGRRTLGGVRVGRSYDGGHRCPPTLRPRVASAIVSSWRLLDGGLGDARGGSRAQVVRGLQSLLPRIEV